MDLDARRRVVGAPATLRSRTPNAEEERDVRELREAPRTERAAASLLVIRQFAELRRRAGLAEKVPRYVT